MINCGRLITTSEETRYILSNNTPTRTQSFNARCPTPRLFNCLSHRDSALSKCLSHRDSALSKCPSHRDSALSKGLSHWDSALSKCLSHWDSALSNCLSHWGSACTQRDPHSSNLQHTRSDTHINVRPGPCGTYFTVFLRS
ncbi:hypothetical protein Adt_02037 [Abeliophyllum distichum]|uniref:Uncharacterized protein n=1 Tax=Abeliophyllum distichum TaxID=126358 RepID=A0ABD1VUJ4_9LAMI